MLYEQVKAWLDGESEIPAFHPIAKIDDRAVWDNIDPKAKSELLKAGEDLLNKEIPPLTASLYAEYFVNGLRKNHASAYFPRRSYLYALSVCECLENKGRFVNKIIDYIWAICEETDWVIPAHVHQNPFAGGIPAPLPEERFSNRYIDLFAAETASVLSWVKYLLCDKLSKYPAVNERIESELRRRIFDNFDNIKLMHWSGFVPGKRLNNWTPWICSNLLAVVLNDESSDESKRNWLLLLSRSVDYFLNTYAPDGGCDEGPGYFNRAGASVLDCLEILDEASNGRVSLWQSELIKNMASYIMRAQIDGEYYINFADAACRVRPDALLLKRCAEKMNDDELLTFSNDSISRDLCIAPWGVSYDGIHRRLLNLIGYREIGKKREAKRELSHYFNGIQVFCAREKADGKGLYMAIKGGHNQESHNHNDIGNFIIYLNGEPFIVDAGVETYSRKTFSEERYEIWTMQSRYHNTAIINDLDQKAGIAFCARDAKSLDDGKTACFECDIAAAYGLNEARYLRKITLNRNEGHIILRDTLSMPSPTTLTLPLLTAQKPIPNKNGVLLYSGRSNLQIDFDTEEFTSVIEEIRLTDPSLKNNWQREKLYRLLLTYNKPIINWSVSLAFREVKG